MAHKVARDNALNLRLFISTSFEFFSSFLAKIVRKIIIIKNISIVNHLLRLRKKDREDRSNSLLNREEEENESLRSFNYQGSFIRVFLSDFNVVLNPFGITATASRRIVATRRTHEEWRRACLGPRYTAN